MNIVHRLAGRTVRRGLRRLGRADRRGDRLLPSWAACCPSSPAALALRWIHDHELPTGGIRVHTRHARAYPEVTGYLVPTLLRCGDAALAIRLVCWLLGGQRQDGAYESPDGDGAYAFDTGQALRGLLAGIHVVPDARQAAARAADYLRRQMI
ncbi:MAG TPA: hypothetical protein VM098_05680, partial [Phycisphaerae bacterium]|nr:hypothetical protein [Phycisphaerae bacterium]